MAYNVYFCCDKCGATWSWVNQTVNLSTATRIARKYGWQVGKTGWLCQNCRNRKRPARALEGETGK